MKGFLLWLALWACRAGTKSLLSCLGCSGQPCTKYFFPHRTLFRFMCPHRPATWAVHWAGSRAGPPVSECVFPLHCCVSHFFLPPVIANLRNTLRRKEDQNWKSQRKFGRLLSIGYFRRSLICYTTISQAYGSLLVFLPLFIFKYMFFT
jgi:hypothetical protein